MVLWDDDSSVFEPTLSRLGTGLLVAHGFMPFLSPDFVLCDRSFEIILKVVFFALEWKPNGKNLFLVLSLSENHFMSWVNYFLLLLLITVLSLSADSGICDNSSVIKDFICVLVCEEFDFLSQFTQFFSFQGNSEIFKRAFSSNSVFSSNSANDVFKGFESELFIVLIPADF